MTKHWIWVAPLLASCTYEPPLNPDFQPTNTIAGTLVADGIDAPADTIILVFDAKDPPPPLGTGRPVTFSAVPASDFTGDGAGVQSAPYAVPYLADTAPETGFAEGYLVTALMDMDGNFNPFAAGTGGSTFGDWVGEHKLGLTALLPEPVFVEKGEIKDDVTILISRQQPFQRPAFTLKDGVLQVSREAASNQDQAQSVRYHIRATGIHTDYGNAPLDLLGPCDRDPALDDATCSASAVCDCDLATFDPSQTAMWVHFMDNDVDGVHDPYPSELQAANGVKDTWPRLYLEYIGTPTTTPDGTVSFENPLAQNLFEWPPDSNRVRPERWVAENYTVAYDLIFLGPTGIAADPTNPFSPFPVFEMNMLFSPAFRHYHADGAYAVDPANGPYDLLDIRCYTSDAGVYPDFASCTGEEIDWNDVPAGAWSLTLVTETGQTWSVPNEIGVPQLAFAVGLDAPLESTDLSVFDVRSQASYLLLE